MGGYLGSFGSGIVSSSEHLGLGRNEVLEGFNDGL